MHFFEIKRRTKIIFVKILQWKFVARISSEFVFCFQGHWWLTVLICVTATIVFILFVKIFSVHTPSSNPNMPKNRQFRETVSTLPRTLRRTRSRHSSSGYSGGRPFTVSSADGPAGHPSGLYAPQDSNAPLRHSDHPPHRSNSRQRRRKPGGSSSNNNDGRDRDRRNGRGRNNRGPPPPDNVPNLYPPPSHSGASPYPPSRQHSSSADPFELQPPPYYA